MNTVVDPELLWKIFEYLLPYIPVTLTLALSSMVLASITGLAVTVIRVRNIPLLSSLAAGYVLIARALPTMIVLYLVFFAIPIGLLVIADITGWQFSISQIPALVFAVIGLTLSTGAYLAEAFRAAIQAVDKGQMEAALSTGMSWRQGFMRIVLPQALVFALPLMANQFLNLIKSTAIAFMITVMELFGAANVFSAATNHYLEVYIVVALVYWSLSICFEQLFLIVEQKMSGFKRGIQA